MCMIMFAFKVNYISSLLDYCAKEKWQQVRSLLEPAEEEYYKYFYRKIHSTTPNTQVTNKETQIQWSLAMLRIPLFP